MRVFGWIELFDHLLPAVGSGQLSVRNGDAGKPESFVRFGSFGFTLNAYRTACGAATDGDQTSILSFPTILASAQYHLWSAPAITNSLSLSPDRSFNPVPTSLNVRSIFPFATFDDADVIVEPGGDVHAPSLEYAFAAIEVFRISCRPDEVLDPDPAAGRPWGMFELAQDDVVSLTCVQQECLARGQLDVEL